MGRAVLYIDEDRAALDMVGEALGRYGMEVDLLEDWRGAIAKMEQRQYDITIISLFVGQREIFSLCEEIRGSLIAHVSDVVLLVVGPEEPEVDEYLKLQMQRADFMSKYRSPEEWADRINLLVSLG